jgi:hypothetical protein
VVSYLGLSVTAEGIENLLDVEFLRDIGCDYIQGYVVFAVVNVQTFTELLSGLVLINPGLAILKNKTEPFQAFSASDPQDHPAGRK